MSGFAQSEYGNMKHQALSNHGDYGVTFNIEDGKAYIGQHQDMKGLEQFATQMRHAAEQGGNQGGALKGQYLGSISPAVLVSWLRKHGYNMNHFSTNAGGERYGRNPDPFLYRTDPGVKSQFLRYYFSRDFSKLHNMHTTTRPEGRQKIWLPGDPK